MIDCIPSRSDATRRVCDDADDDDGAAAPVPPTSEARRRKKPEDTPAGCRDFAAADLLRAAGLGGHARGRYELSAATWKARADMLARLEAKFLARMRKAQA